MGFGGVGQVDGFAFFNQRADPVNLSPFSQLATNALHHFVAPAVVDDLGDDGRAPRRQLIDGRHIEVGVVTHGQRARNRRGRHHQQMRLLPVRRHLAAQRQALCHAKAVLLVNDRQRQIFKHHFVLNHGVRADHQTGLAAGNQGQCFAPFLGFLAAGEPRGLNAHRLEPADEFAKVLLSQDFSRRHQGALPASVHAAGGRQRRHHGFARADIALQQAVHRHIFLQVSVNLMADALLRCGQPKRQPLF